MPPMCFKHPEHELQEGIGVLYVLNSGTDILKSWINTTKCMIHVTASGSLLQPLHNDHFMILYTDL